MSHRRAVRTSITLALWLPLAAIRAAGATPDSTGGFAGSSTLVVPAAAFTHDGTDADGYLFDSGGFWTVFSSTTACLRAPVYLPDHAEIAEVRASILDRDGSEVAVVTLERTTSAAYSSAAEIASVLSTTDTSDYEPDWVYDDSIVLGTIDNQTYSYSLVTCFDSTEIRLYQVWIYYAERLIFRDGFESANTTHWNPGLDYGSPLTVPAADFRSSGADPGGVRFEPDQGSLRGVGSDGLRYVVAPVQLPDGATVTDLVATVRDNDPGGGLFCAPARADIEIWLRRVNADSGASDVMANDASSGHSTSLQLIGASAGEISWATIDSPAYSYYLVVRLCSTLHQFWAAQLYYTLP